MNVDRHIQRIRLFLVIEALAFNIAALLHVGQVIQGYERQEAILFECILASVLFIGSLLTWISPSWTRRIGVAVQGMVLFSTVIGRFGIIAGGSSWTIFDLVFYRAIIATLIWGFIVTIIAPTFHRSYTAASRG